MNEEKITIKIADQTGFRISESDMTTGKIVVNGVEVTDTESWNKAISTFTELEYQLEQKDKEIERLNNIINEFIDLYNKQGMYGEVEYKEKFGSIVRKELKELKENNNV